MSLSRDFFILPTVFDVESDQLMAIRAKANKPKHHSI